MISERFASLSSRVQIEQPELQLLELRLVFLLLDRLVLEIVEAFAFFKSKRLAESSACAGL